MTIICPPPLDARPEHPDLYVRDQWDYAPLAKPMPITEQRWPEGTRPLVSVKCITFNHEKYIRQAMEGFLMQQTTFPVQIFVHDDASCDKTASIIREYEDIYPDLFLVVLQPVNLYSRAIHRQTDHLLFGKYIAYCEGDDHWTHPWKLQIQCAHMLLNPNVALVYHPVLVLDEEGNPRHDYTRPPRSVDHRKYFLEHGNFIHTPSVMTKVHCTPMPPEAAASPAGDFFNWLLALNVGQMYMIPNCMAVYRLGSGRWSSIPDETRAVKTLTIFFSVMEYCSRIDLSSECDTLSARIVSGCKHLCSSISEEQLHAWSMIGPASSLLVQNTLKRVCALERAKYAKMARYSKCASLIKNVARAIIP